MKNVELVSQLLANVQRLGSKEDILTGVLACFFQTSRTFAARFFETVITLAGVDVSTYFSIFPESYGVVTGEKVSKKRYAWIEDKRIAFAPDIWIFDQTGDEWHEIKPKPAPSFHFLIECKESAKVTKGQLRGYPFFEDDLFGKTAPRVFTLLIHGHAAPEEKSQFTLSLSWLELFALLNDLVRTLSTIEDGEDLQFLLALFQHHLSFDATKALGPALKDHEAALAFAEWIRSRLPCDGTIKPRTATLTLGPKNFHGKWLCLNSDQKTTLWLYIERKNGVFHLQVEKWLEQSPLGRSTKIALAKDASEDEWNALLIALMAEQQSFVEELV